MTRWAPRRTDDESGQLTERRDRRDPLLEPEPRMNREAAPAKRAAGVVTKEPLG